MSRGTHRRTLAVCAFLPPHILQSIAENTDDPDLRERCHVALETSAQFRGARAAAGQSEGLIASSLRRTIYDAERKTALPGKLLRGEGAKPVADVAAEMQDEWIEHLSGEVLFDVCEPGGSGGVPAAVVSQIVVVWWSIGRTRGICSRRVLFWQGSGRGHSFSNRLYISAVNAPSKNSTP